MDIILEDSKQVLLVGEGNFSFSSSLQQNLPVDVKVVATCFETSLPTSNGAQENVNKLKEHGSTVLCGIDATRLEDHSHLSQLKPFDCIIFQFPHVGGKGNIKKNRNLLKDFFASASKVLSRDGKVLVTLCNGQGGTPKDSPQREWNNSWQVVAMATYGDFILTQTVPFDKVRCHLYKSTGYRGQDKSFNVSGAVMHIFCQSQAYPASLGTEEKNHIYSRILGWQKQTYATVMKLFCEHLAEDSRNDIVTNERDHSPERRFHEYLQVGNEYGAAKEACLDIQKPPSNQSDHRRTSNQYSGFAGFISSMELIQDHCCIGSLVQNVPNGRIISSDVKIVSKNCPINPFCYPVMHYAILTMPRKGTDFKDLQEKIVSSISLQCRTGDNMKVTKSCENAFDILGSCLLETKCGHCCKISTDDAGVSFHRNVLEKDGFVVPLSCTFFHRSNRMLVVFCLEHFMMNKFKIEDIRHLWSLDERWWEKLSHFLTGYDRNQDGCSIQPISLYPPSYTHDLSFWESLEKKFDESEFISLIREVTGDSVRELYLVETFQLAEKRSRCYRMIYQSCDQALTNHEAGRLQMTVRECIKETLDLTLR